MLSNISISWLFNILLIGFGISLILLTVQENPVYIIFTFVLVISFTYLFLLLQLFEFFALLIIIIYTGVIAVIFLFTIIIYNLRDFLIYEFWYLVHPVFLVMIYKLVWSFYPYINFFLPTTYRVKVTYLDLNTFDLLYYYQLDLFLLIACILVVAIIGSVVITFSFHHTNYINVD